MTHVLEQEKGVFFPKDKTMFGKIEMTKKTIVGTYCRVSQDFSLVFPLVFPELAITFVRCLDQALLSLS